MIELSKKLEPLVNIIQTNKVMSGERSKEKEGVYLCYIV